jgi:hypothetical protein
MKEATTHGKRNKKSQLVWQLILAPNLLSVLSVGLDQPSYIQPECLIWVMEPQPVIAF